MQYRPFGKTGVNISTLGFGCMRLPEFQAEDGSWQVTVDLGYHDCAGIYYFNAYADEHTDGILQGNAQKLLASCQNP